MPPVLPRAIATGLVAAATVATLAPTSARASSPSAPPRPPAPAVPADVRAAMARDLGLTAEAVSARIADERAAERAATAVRAALGDRVTALWFDAADGHLHAAVRGAADAAAAERSGAVVHRARLSRSGLDTVLASVGRQVRGVPGVVSWGPVASGDRIEVAVDPARATAATAALRDRLAARHGDDVRVVETHGAPVQQGGDVIGGEKWVPGTESPCSIGFPVTRSGGASAFLTAGHCTNDADQPAYGKDGSRLGTSNRRGTGSVNAAEGDFGIVEVDQSGWRVAPTVAGWGQGDVTVTGSAEALVGTAVCHSGQTSGFHCGQVTKVDQTVDYGNVVIGGLSYTSACSAGGDSGGSYVTASGGKAVGLHSGGGSATCSGGSGEKFTIFQPVGEALAKFGVSLVTSAPQPGQVSVAAVSDRTSATGTAVELRNSAEGGTAPYTWSASRLPAGLSIARSTGTVTGTPTTPGTSTVTVTATDAAGKTGSTSFTWTVTAPGTGAPTLANPGGQSLRVGTPFTLALRATGGTAPYAFTGAGLPAGLTVNRTTGVVSGTPTTWGMSNATLTVTDAAGRKSSVGVTFTVWF
ncbi:putative Ig domain-containing protein [Streptomyces sp. NPDC048182]|uniref:putative Ig domain-containing protein n=1 Tax=Streptomyces sp. NPDC048182 TaxID=3365507 RepID=UPI003716A578